MRFSYRVSSLINTLSHGPRVRRSAQGRCFPGVPMPLLEAEPRAFPDTLFSGPSAGGAREDRWWVLYTRARMEKAVARQLRGQQVSFYLPLYEQTWKTGGRKRTSYLPLFPGYVFLYGDGYARLTALETNLLCAVIPVTDQERLFNDLCRVERVLGGSSPATPETAVPAGALVEITSGPFRGLCGNVLCRGAETRLVIEVEFLRRGVSIEVEDWALRVLPAADPATKPR
ncbi:MAG: transcription antiterminator [Gemmataceae bacterium]|nr:transcription antiterminator [Gemmataceae bacterium]